MFGQCTPPPPGWPRAVCSDNVLSVVYTTRVGDVRKLFELFACHVRCTASRTPTAETISPTSANGSIIIIIIIADDDCISVRGRTDPTVHVRRTKNAPRVLRGLDVHGFKILFFYNFSPHIVLTTFGTVVLRSRPTTARDHVPFENFRRIDVLHFPQSNVTTLSVSDRYLGQNEFGTVQRLYARNRQKAKRPMRILLFNVSKYEYEGENRKTHHLSI